MFRKLTAVILLNLLFVCAIIAQTTDFTYQGRLLEGSFTPTANYDFEFDLYDAVSGGTQLGSTDTKLNVAVVNGIFTVNLSFAGQFSGAARFLEIRVRNAGGGAYETLTPRQPVTSAPYAIKSLNSDNATNATNATTATTATNFSGSLSGNVTGTQGATVVSSVGGVTATNVANGATLANNSTSANTANAIVRRNGVGSFSTGEVVANRITLPTTTSSTVGVIRQGSQNLLSTFNNNLMIGNGIGNSTTTGSGNVAVGMNGFQFNTTGIQNVGMGNQTLFSNTSGVFNTAIGFQSLRDNTTGRDNTAIGYSSLSSNVTGNGNVGLGIDTLQNTTGTDNIGIGYRGGRLLTTGSNNIAIGNRGVAGESNTTRLGSVQTRTFIAGISGVTSSGGTAVFINGSGQLGTLTSSRRFKYNIFDMKDSSEAIFKLRPVNFLYKKEIDSNRIPQWGLIAEEVNKVNPDLVIRNTDGTIQTVRYEQINAMLLNEFLKEHKRVKKLIEENEAMKLRLAELEKQEKDREARLEKLEKLLLPKK